MVCSLFVPPASGQESVVQREKGDSPSGLILVQLTPGWPTKNPSVKNLRGSSWGRNVQILVKALGARQRKPVDS